MLRVRFARAIAPVLLCWAMKKPAHSVMQRLRQGNTRRKSAADDNGKEILFVTF